MTGIVGGLRRGFLLKVTGPLAAILTRFAPGAGRWSDPLPARSAPSVVLEGGGRVGSGAGKMSIPGALAGLSGRSIVSGLLGTTGKL